MSETEGAVTMPDHRPEAPGPVAHPADAASGRRGRVGARDAYHPPESAEDDHWLSLGAKVAIAMFLGDLVARASGFDDPTWSVISAAYLATSPPFASIGAVLRKLLALTVGIALGCGGAFLAEPLAGVPSLHFAVVGLIVGALATRSADYLFAAVVATIVTFVGARGGDPLPEVLTTTACMVIIGCAVGPGVVWSVERGRRLLAERRR